MTHNVCFVVFAFPPEYSGATFHALEFGEFLKETGLRLTFLSHTTLTQFEKEIQYNGYRAVRFHFRLDKNDGLSSYHWKLLVNLFRLRNSFGSIYLNGNPGQFWTPFYVILFGKVFRKRVFVEMNMEYKTDPLCIRNTRLEAFKSYVASMSSGYISLSTAITKCFRKVHRFESLLIHSPNGVNTVRFRPLEAASNKKTLREKLSLPIEGKIIVTVGAIVKRKGIDLLMEIFEDVVSRRRDCHFVLVGPNSGMGVDERFAQNMLRLADAPPLRPNVHFVGAVANVHEYLQAADVFVFAGRQEGSPNVIREAMACGLPVVTLNLPGCSTDMIDHEKDGILINLKDPRHIEEFWAHKVEDTQCKSAFLEWILRLVADDEFAHMLGKNAREKVLHKFSMEKRAHLFADLFCCGLNGKTKLTPSTDQHGMKNILYVHLTSGIGGGTTCLYSLLSALDRERYNPIVLCYAEHAYMEKIRQLGVKVIRVPKTYTFLGRSHLLSLLFDEIPFAIRLLITILKEKVDLVHLNNDISRHTGGIMGAALSSKPTIITMRGAIGDYVSKVSTFLSRYVSTFVSVSGHVATQEVARLARKNQRSVVVYDGVDLRKYRYKQQPTNAPDNQPFVIGIVGNLHEYKGHRVFLQAAGRIRQCIDNVRFVIVGKVVNQEYYDELVDLVDQLNLHNQVVFTGFVEHIPDTLLSFDIFVLASYTEGLPTVVLEAMACGLPVVASKVGGIPEAVTDGVDGVVIEPGDPLLLADSVIKIYEDKVLRDRIARAARKTVEDKFNVRNTARRYEHIYHEFLKQDSPN